MIRNKAYNQSGFTLIESLVAIAIIIIAVGGPIALATQSLSTSTEIRNRIVSIYLAQEGIEALRNMRDTNILEAESWTNGFDACIPGPCRVDVASGGDAVLCSGGNCPVLRFDTLDGLYGGYTEGGSEWEDTIYTRTISIQEINQDELAIQSDVSWPVGSHTETVTVRDTLHNWQSR